LEGREAREKIDLLEDIRSGTIAINESSGGGGELGDPLMAN